MKDCQVITLHIQYLYEINIIYLDVIFMLVWNTKEALVRVV
jgi:hypothetical protein